MNTYSSSNTYSVTPIKKNAYLDQIFCYIENGEDQKVIQFFQKYPQVAQKVSTQNNWSPAMYAARYGRLQLLQFLKKENLISNGVPYTVVHAACFGNQYQVLKYLLDQLNYHHTPLSYDNTPLKICLKINNLHLSEFLISRGAFYTFNDFTYNLVPFPDPNGGEKLQYHTFGAEQRKEDSDSGSIPEISDVYIYQVTQIPSSKLLKEYFRWLRIQNMVLIEQYCNPASGLKKILQNNNYKNHLLEFLVGPQKSKVDVIQQE